MPREVAKDYERPVVDLVNLFTGVESSPATRKEIEMRLDAARKVDLKEATIVIASWENPFAAAGGVQAVTKEYAEHLASKNRRVKVVTPLHMGLRNPPGTVTPVAVVWVDFMGMRRRVEVLKSERAGVDWVYLHCDGFFAAEGGRSRSNPYLYKFDAECQKKGEGSPLLVKDCLLYAVAFPGVLCALGLWDNVVLHLQDWVTSGAALTVKEAILQKRINRAVCVLALHNPYDKSFVSPHLPKSGWELLTKLPEPPGPSTFLAQMIPLLDAPPVTVSREFAIDLSTDPLQTEYFANHLQAHFKRFGLIGVDHGPFEKVPAPFSDDAVAAAREGRPEEILSQKGTLRKAMTAAMAEYRPEERWGDVDFGDLGDGVPVFMCVGRLDPRQKGFDVAVHAIERLLTKNEKSGGEFDGRFVLAPITGDEPLSFHEDLRALAERHPGKVVVYPFRMQQGYQEIQAGCSFSLWPSMYEPFGAVSEFLMRGTPVIARSTGGLRQQVVDFDAESGAGNGVLYGTLVPPPGSGEWSGTLNEEDPGERLKYPVYEDQVEQLAGAIRRAAGIFKDDQAYGRLLSNVLGFVADYGWDRAEEEYRAIYEIATR